MIWINKSNEKRKRGLPRRRVKPFWQYPVFAACVMIFIAGGISFAGWWFWHSDWLSQTAKRAVSSFILSTAKNGFVVREILVEGRIQTSRQDLLKALRLKSGASILAFNPGLARIRVEALPWVQKAVIERQLPDVVHLFLSERLPLALWQQNGIFSLIDINGDLIPLKDVSAYSNLIVIIGRDAPAKAANLFQVLAMDPRLASQVTAAVRVGERRWNLHLNGQTEILLPEKNADAAWAHLANLYKKNDELFNNLKTIDLRLADRMVIRRRDKSVVKKGEKGLPAIQLKSTDNLSKRLKRQMNPNTKAIPSSGKET